MDAIHRDFDSDEARAAQKQVALDYRTGKYCDALLLGSPAPAQPEGLVYPAFFVAVFSAGCPGDSFSQLLQQFSPKAPPEKSSVLIS